MTRLATETKIYLPVPSESWDSKSLPNTASPRYLGPQRWHTKAAALIPGPTKCTSTAFTLPCVRPQSLLDFVVQTVACPSQYPFFLSSLRNKVPKLIQGGNVTAVSHPAPPKNASHPFREEHDWVLAGVLQGLSPYSLKEGKAEPFTPCSAFMTQRCGCEEGTLRMRSMLCVTEYLHISSGLVISRIVFTNFISTCHSWRNFCLLN